MDTVLRAAWHGCVGSRPGSAQALDGLVARYAEPHRRYHGLGHLRSVVRDIGVLVPTIELDVDPALIRLAGFFHDAIYDPRSPGNEAASAQLARRVLGELEVDASAIDEIDRLIMTTIDHAADDNAAAVLSDADLAVLGADPAAYQAYATGVRTEYAHVDDESWHIGRPIVLQRFLDRALIYRTPSMHVREGRARANLTAELRSLVAGAASAPAATRHRGG